MATTIDMHKGFTFHQLNIAGADLNEVRAILNFIGYFHQKPLFLDNTRDAEKFKSISLFFVHSLDHYIERFLDSGTLKENNCSLGSNVEEDSRAFEKFTTKEPEGKILLDIMNTLTNITGNEHYDTKFLADDEFMEFMANVWFTKGKLPIILPSSFGSMVNLTHTLQNAQSFFKRFPNAVEEIVSGLLRVPVSAAAKGYCNGYFDTLCNLSRLGPVRNIIVDGKGKSIFAKLILYLNEGMGLPKESRRPLVSTIKHCLMDMECHKWLLGDGVDIVPFLLLPLMGNEEYTDEEYETMPIECQYLEKSKSREPVQEIRSNLLFCLLQISRTPEGRNYLRKANVVVILRELMKFEVEEENRDSIDIPNVTIIQNIVEVLIKEEKEIGPNPNEPFVIPNPVLD